MSDYVVTIVGDEGLDVQVYGGFVSSEAADEFLDEVIELNETEAWIVLVNKVETRADFMKKIG